MQAYQSGRCACTCPRNLFSPNAHGRSWWRAPALSTTSVLFRDACMVRARTAPTVTSRTARPAADSRRVMRRRQARGGAHGGRGGAGYDGARQHAGLCRAGGRRGAGSHGPAAPCECGRHGRGRPAPPATRVSLPGALQGCERLRSLASLRPAQARLVRGPAECKGPTQCDHSMLRHDLCVLPHMHRCV